jgi:phosphate starvation-inducible protein PhoH/intein/homing endonuclease
MAEKNGILRKIDLPERGVEALFGPYDENIKYLEELLGVRVTVRDSDVMIEGEQSDVDAVQRIFEDYGSLLGEGRRISGDELRSAFKQIAEDRAYTLREHLTSARINPTGKKQVTARSVNQRRYLDAIEKNDVVFGIGVAGTGKCIAANSLVLTANGLVEIGELGIGTTPDDQIPVDLEVHGIDGREYASHVYNGGVSDTLRVTTRLGYAIEVTPEHPLLVLEERARLTWRRADALRVGDTLALQRGQRMFGTETAVSFSYKPNGPNDRTSRPVALDRLDDEVAYIMGVLVGDGCLTFRNRVILSSVDESIISGFRSIASRFGLRVFRNGGTSPRSDFIIASSQLYQLLTELGLSTGKADTKRVPRSIFRAPETIVSSFLRGLFDADGTVDKRDGTISFSTVSDALARDVHVLLLNFGILAARGTKRGTYLGRRHESHRLTITGRDAELFDDLIGFGLLRKAEKRVKRRTNSNVDLIPGLGGLLRAAKRTASIPKPTQSLFNDYRWERRRPSYAKLGQLIATIESHGGYGIELETLSDLHDRKLLFLDVADITPSRAQVFDLTVPETHSFVANGFVNHNTYLAVAMAIQALWTKKVNRIVLARPAVEAGEKLGFLPGDLQDKVDPYLRPLYDALFDLVDYERVTKLLEKRVIEIAPLAFMRGRTLSEAFIILDEAQNTTTEQMKMFLTRIGLGSKAVITGDVTQIDLPTGRRSGLIEAQSVLKGLDGLEFIYFNDKDVVRHRLVQMIIRAYDEHSKARFDDKV